MLGGHSIVWRSVWMLSLSMMGGCIHAVTFSPGVLSIQFNRRSDVLRKTVNSSRVKSLLPTLFVSPIMDRKCFLGGKILILGLAVCVSGAMASAQSPSDPDLILARMKANDAQLFRLELQYMTTGEFYTKANPSKPSPSNAGAAETIPDDNQPKPTVIRKTVDLAPYLNPDRSANTKDEAARIVNELYDSKWMKSEYSYLEHLVVNEETVAGKRWESRDATQVSEMRPLRHWISNQGIVKVLSAIPVGDGKRTRWILETETVSVPVNSVQEQWMWLQFALGVGFGERIKSVAQTAKEGSSYRMSGRIQVWWADESDFSLLVDAGGIVREAVIRSTVDGNVSELRATSAGEASAGDIDLAKSGSFTRTNIKNPRPTVKFNVTVVDVKSQISEERLLQFLTPSPNSGEEYQEINYDRIRLDNAPAKLRVESRWNTRQILVWINIITLVSGAFWFFRMQRRRRLNG